MFGSNRCAHAGKIPGRADTPDYSGVPFWRDRVSAHHASWVHPERNLSVGVVSVLPRATTRSLKGSDIERMSGYGRHRSISSPTENDITLILRRPPFADPENSINAPSTT